MRTNQWGTRMRWFHPKMGCEPGRMGDMGTRRSLEAAGGLGGDGDKSGAPDSLFWSPMEGTVPRGDVKQLL